MANDLLVTKEALTQVSQAIMVKVTEAKVKVVSFDFAAFPRDMDGNYFINPLSEIGKLLQQCIDDKSVYNMVLANPDTGEWYRVFTSYSDGVNPSTIGVLAADTIYTHNVSYFQFRLENM